MVIGIILPAQYFIHNDERVHLLLSNDHCEGSFLENMMPSTFYIIIY